MTHPSLQGGRFSVRHDKKLDVRGLLDVTLGYMPPTHTIIDHPQMFKTEPESEIRVKAFAFYADCEHRLEPITAGHRLCLVGRRARGHIVIWHCVCGQRACLAAQAFNLVRTCAGEIPQCPPNTSRAGKMAKIVQEWCQRAPDMLRQVLCQAVLRMGQRALSGCLTHPSMDGVSTQAGCRSGAPLYSFQLGFRQPQRPRFGDRVHAATLRGQALVSSSQ